MLAEIEEHFLAQLSVEETAPGTTLDLEHHIELLLLGDFLSSGAYALVFRWLKNDCRQSPKQVAELLAKIIRYGVALPEF